MDGLDLSEGAGASWRTLNAEGRRTPPPRRRDVPWRTLSLLLIVLLPTIAVAVYYLAFAADQYVSETRFVVRGPQAAAPAALAGILGGAGGGRAGDDTYAVQDWMLSRDALAELVRDEDATTAFARPEADRLARFPLFGRFDTFEHLYAYYLRHVEAELDSSTGVSILKVRSFRARDSQRLAAALLAGGERLVNRMNERQRDAALREARREVEAAESRVREVADRIAEFRNREALLDPARQSVPMLQAVADLEAQLTRVRLQVAQLTASSPQSPLIADEQLRAAALERQIAAARAKVAGGDASMVPKIAAFDMLTLQRDFADRQLGSATASLEAARLQAGRQTVYLDAIVQPDAPDYPAYPRPAASIAVVFVSALGMWVAGALLLAGAREHART